MNSSRYSRAYIFAAILLGAFLLGLTTGQRLADSRPTPSPSSPAISSVFIRSPYLMQPRPDGQFLWHMGFQSVPDIPELLLQGNERPYLQWFFEHFAYDPSAITAADIDEYVAAMTQVGALRGGLAVYRAYFETAEQVASHATKPLDIPVVAYGGEACLGELTLTSVRAVAPDAEGGVIPRCGHWAAEERPTFVADVIGGVAAQGAERARRRGSPAAAIESATQH